MSYPDSFEYDSLRERLWKLPRSRLWELPENTRISDEVKTLDYGEELYVIGQALVLIGQELNGIRTRVK